MASPLEELSDALQDIETLLKNPDVESALAAKGVNSSLAMVVLDGMRAYVEGDKAKAAEELGTFAEEVKGRLALSSGQETN